MEIDFKEFSLKLLDGLSKRAKDIIIRRFALSENFLKKESLESIGKDYRICRERVRQIEENNIKLIKEKINSPAFSKNFQEIEKEIIDYLKQNGGVKREDILLTRFAPGQENFLSFLLSFSDLIKKLSSKDKELYPLFYIRESNLEKCKEIINFTLELLEKRKSPIDLSEVIQGLKKEENIFLPVKQISSFLEVSRKIGKTIDGKIGLVTWPEVKPKTVRDKINLVLKQTQKPLHFKEITDLINKINQALGETKPLNAQTVHNELIRNDKFVLVGRGVYALKEWGYEPGQVKDIIFKVLKSSHSSLSKDEILKEVLKQRMVKESTVLLNLQNKKLFSKDNSGKYKVREA
jgi:predicted CopG family antitoxin